MFYIIKNKRHIKNATIFLLIIVFGFSNFAPNFLEKVGFSSVSEYLKIKDARAAISYINRATVCSSSANPIVSVPTGTVNNDVMVLIINSKSSETLNAPAGWTRIGTQLTQGSVLGTLGTSIFYRVANSEPASYTLTITAVSHCAAIAAYRGVDTVAPVDTSSQQADTVLNNTHITTAPITPTATNTEILFFVGDSNDKTHASYTNTGASLTWTERLDVLTAQGTDNSIAMASATMGTPASTGNTQTLTTGANSLANLYLVALKPAPSAITFGVTSGSKAATLNSGDVSQYANEVSCADSATCAAFTFISSDSETVTSIKITETGTSDATNDLSNLALFYDTDGNYSNGVTGQYGSTVPNFTAESATVSGSLLISAGVTYYFYVGFDLGNGGAYPNGGQTIDFQIAANSDVGTLGSPIKTGTPVSLAGTTSIKPNATSVTYGSGLSDGGRSNESITISGFGFGAPLAGANRDNCSGAVNTGCVRFIVGGAATVLNTDITAWSNTSITFGINSSSASNGGVSSLEIVAGSQNDTTALTFYVYPNITGMSTCAAGGDRDNSCGTNAALEYLASDTFGLIQLNGDHFSSASGTVQFTGGFGSIAGTVHAIAEGACASAGWTSTSVCVEVNSAISDTIYDGTVTLTRVGDSKTDTIDLHILPRIISNTPVSGVASDTITIDGNHFCQTGVCPVSPPTADYKVLFGATETIISDFVSTGDCLAQGASWSDTRICVKVPTGVSIGSQKTKVVGKTSPLYESQRKGFSVLSSVPDDPDVGPGVSKGQFKSDEVTLIAVGGMTNESTVVLRADISASLAIDMALQIETQSVGVSFVCGAGNCITAAEGTIIGGGACTSCLTLAGAKVAVSGLSDGTKHWQARVRNINTNEYSNWISFGGNLESEIDFSVDGIGPTITFTPTDSCAGGQSNLGTNRITISWSLNETANGQVEYGTNPSLSSSAFYPVPPSASAFSHTITLLNLDSNTIYYYRVKSSDGVGNTTLKSPSAPYCSFITGSVNQPAKSTSFYIIGKTNMINATTTDSTNFSVLVPETSPVVKSAFVEIVGVSDSPGNNNIQVQVNSQAINTYVIDASNKTNFKIIYEVNPGDLNLNNNPAVNVLSITPSINTYIASAKIITSYAYTP